MANAIHGVLYLERDKFQLSIETRPDILTYVFPPNLVNNLDFIDVDAFKLNLEEFVKKNTVTVTNLITVISSSIIFEQDFKTEEETKIQEFLDNVPYETISIKKIPIQGGTKLLIANASFYEVIGDIFKKNGTRLDFVIPERALGANIGSFSAATARLILSQSESLSQSKFVTDESTENKIEYKPPEKKVVVHKKNYTLFYSIPVFALLLLVLAFMILQPIIFKQKSKTVTLAATIPTLAPAYVPPTIVPSIATPTGSSSAALKKPATVQIIYDPSAQQKVDQLKAILAAVGVPSVQSLTVASSLVNPVVLVSPAIDPNEKTKLIEEVKTVFPNATLQNGTETAIDVMITVGKTQ